MDLLKTVSIDRQTYDYLLRQAEPPTPAQAHLIDRTNDLGESAEMQIPHEQAVFFTLLTRMTDARLVVEVGTYTGYSTLAFARGLPPEGRVITCDISTEWGVLAKEVWSEAGVDHQIDLRIGPAAETLRALPVHPGIDIAFIDADKVGYIEYWELLVPRVRPGGVLLADNVLYYGDAARPDPTGNARAIDLFNQHVRADDRVESVLLPIADGLTVARKKATVPGEAQTPVLVRATR